MSLTQRLGKRGRFAKVSKGYTDTILTYNPFMVIIILVIKYPKAVIPAKAGIQIFQALMDSVAIPSTCGRVVNYFLDYGYKDGYNK